MIRDGHTYWPAAARQAVWTATLLAMAACAAPDPFPGAGSEPPASRLADGLLERPELQVVVEATLARDAAALAAFLADPDPAVRARAAYGLGSVQDSSTVPALTRLLTDPEAAVREDAAFALGQMEGGVGQEAVQALRRERDARVRRALVEALGKRGGASEMEDLLGVSDPQLLPDVTLALSRGVLREVAPEYTVDTLVARMGNPDPEVRRAATYFMARLAVPNLWFARLRDIVQTLDAYERDDEAAMYILAGLGRAQSLFTDPVAIPWLATSPDWRIRANAAAAVQSLYEIHVEAGRALVRALDDPSHHVRQRAAEALATAPPIPSLLQTILAEVEARPGDVPMVEPLLPLLVRAGAMELVHAHMATLTPEHEVTWRAVLEAFKVLPPPVALRELLAIMARDNVSDEVAAAAASQLADRWMGVRHIPDAQDAYEAMLAEVVPGGDPARVWPLAAVLADTVLLDRGSLERLQTLRAAAVGTAAEDDVTRTLALATDARARALVDPDRVAAIRAEAEAQAAFQEDPGAQAAAAREDDGSEEPRLAVDWDALRALGPRPRLVLETERGTVVVVLRPEEAPLTVQAVASLATEGRYDGVPFHRVLPNFVAQGGDVSHGDGSGGPGFVLRSEFTRTPFLRGVMGMASSGKDTEGSQYFITHSPQWHLDGLYTAFGWVERGMDVVDRIQRGDRVITARVVPSRR